MEIKGRADMMSLTAEAMRWGITLVKIANFSGFKYCWKHLE